MTSKNTVLPADTAASIRASATCLCWKRAADMPSHLRVHQGTFKRTATVTLSYSAVFPPTTAPLRGVILFLHGINEHSERYFHLFEALCDMDFGVIGYDWRSHGRSHWDVPDLLGHVEHFDELINDTNDLIAFIKDDIFTRFGVAQNESKLPWVIMGMSLGTLISLHTILSQRHNFQGVILAAPAINTELTLVLRLLEPLGPILSTLCPRARIVPGVNAQFMCRDPLVNADFDADPLTTRENITSRMGDEVAKAMRRLKRTKSIEQSGNYFCNIPMLMLMGTSDKVTSLPEAKKFYERIGTRDKQFELIDGAYHVIFEDFERAKVIQLIKTWLQTRFPRN